uniref:Uncharacterized protein n=1 Tax=Ditylenchus dipsaci TaxID=166011 RepID=A0A915EWP3_9BILA
MGKAFKDVFEVDVNCNSWMRMRTANSSMGLMTKIRQKIFRRLISAFPLRVKCVAHSLQLAIVDEFRMCVLPSLAYSKMMDVVRAFRKSPLAIQELDEATGKALLSVSNTRWSYKFWNSALFGARKDVRAIAKSRNMNPPTSIEVEFVLKCVC